VAHVSEPRFLTLLGTRLRGFAEPPAIASAVGLDIATVTEQLAKLAADELVVHRDGRLVGWSLTADGRAEQQRLAAADADAAGATDAVRGAYARFLAVNGELLGVCTDWQLRGGVPNDHRDPAHDTAVLARLRAVHDAVTPILADLAGALPRFAVYVPRLAAALERVDAGEVEYVTKPLIDSFHTVWFELHEDLLATLGIERSQEGSA
jgi:DNA-binding MarR family transcriptional regulator